MKIHILLLSILFSLSIDAQTNFLVLGDSNGAAINGWVSKLEKSRPIEDKFCNLSIAGNTIGFNNLDKDTLNTLHNIKKYLRRGETQLSKIDVILISLGTNDCKSQFAKQQKEVVPNMIKLLDSIKSYYSKASREIPRIVLISPPPMSDDSKLEEKYKGGANRLKLLVEQLSKLDVEFINTHTPLIKSFNSLTTDGVHLNDSGYEMMGELIWKYLANRIFVIGDSISIHYGPFLKQSIAGKYKYDRKRDIEEKSEINLDNPVGANGGNSQMVLDYIREVIKNGKFNTDILLVNCGLHDIKVDVNTGKIQIPIEQYIANLNSIYQEIEKTGIRFIWITTTPVNDFIHNSISTGFKRYNSNVILYNNEAEKFFKSKNVEIIDLYTFSNKFPVDAYIDHVHYKESYRKLQGQFIADFLNTKLKVFVSN